MFLAGLLMMISASAQVDVSQYYLVNSGFDTDFDYKSGATTAVKEEIKEVDGWTADLTATYTIVGTYEYGFAGTFNTAKVPSAGYDGGKGGGLAISTGWDQTFLFYQTVTLPAGTYTVNVPTYNGCDVTAATSQLAWIPASGTSVKSSVTSYKANSWTLDKITFTLTKTTTGKIQFGMKAASGGSANSAKLLVDYVQIMGENMQIDKTELGKIIASANSYYGDGSGEGAADLKSAIDAAQAIYDNAESNLIEVLESQNTLKDAIEVYRKLNVSEESPLDYTEYVINPSFEKGNEGWTNVGLSSQSNNSFTKKKGTYYLEKWVSSGSAGSVSVIQLIKGLPNGQYKLVAAAMNGSATTNSNTGAYIFAGDKQTVVNGPKDYEVKFTSISGEVEIGFVGKSVSSNWVAVDNFRLYLIGKVDANAVIDELQRIIADAEALQTSVMSSTAAAKLQTAIDAAKQITTTSADAEIQTATKNLNAAIEAAKVSIAEVAELNAQIAEGEALLPNMMSTTVVAVLQSAIDAAKLISATSTDAEVQTALKNIKDAVEAAETNAKAYKALADKIATIEPKYDETKEGAADFKVVIDEAKALVVNAEATNEQLAEMVVALDKALLAFNIANATPGTGTAPKVTSTNHYVPTGATEALMRATFTGSNIIERGVCWSKEHNPTVLDDRTTENHQLNGYIFHLRGLESATVYYLRPYVINKTYTVAYGDEVKIVTHPKGTCTGSWNEGAPSEAANARCRNAIRETIEYFNQWTGIKGFHLTGNYGADTPTADCSYGGWMRIGPNAGNQAIGTVIHETGHGVGVGTHWRWYDCADTRANTTHGKWLGREANDMLDFLENDYTENKFMTGDGTHGWGTNASYDWFVNGADKDKHLELQYLGGCCLLYALFVDGLPPTNSYPNGLPAYTYNFDSEKKYYIMNKDAERGLGEGLVYQRTASGMGWKPFLANEVVTDSAAWYIEFDAQNGYYSFKNVATGRYMTHASGQSAVQAKNVTTKPGTTEKFQLMPDRTDVTVGVGDTKIKTHGYWFTWYDGKNKAMNAAKLGSYTGYGALQQADFDFSDKATAQQWILISEDELEAYQAAAIATGIGSIKVDDADVNGEKTVVGIYTVGGVRLNETTSGFNIIRYSDGTSKKIFVK